MVVVVLGMVLELVEALLMPLHCRAGVHRIELRNAQQIHSNFDTREIAKLESSINITKLNENEYFFEF